VLGAPDETVRRRLLALQRHGLATHHTRGWLPAAEPSAWPQLSRLLAQNEANLRRLFARLDELKLQGPLCA
jgi:hypothetical protein